MKNFELIVKKFEKNSGKKAGTIYMVLQAFLFSTMGIFLKSVKPMQSFEIGFYRSIIMSLINVFVLKYYNINPYRNPKDKYFVFFISRSLSGFLTISSAFYALSISSISEVTSVLFLSPSIILFFFYTFLCFCDFIMKK